VSNIVRKGETISARKLERRAGGKGANQAVGIAKAGGVIDLVGAVGDDGQWVHSYLASLGVNVSGVEIVKVSK
jgi:ribokinase